MLSNLLCALLHGVSYLVNPLNAELNPICHLLALLGGATIVVVSRLRVKNVTETLARLYFLNSLISIHNNHM